jgi:hypothetical protein
MGIPEQLTNLIVDWLSNRVAYCEVNKVNSSLFEITHGTIQGSILGAILFALYISPLADTITTTTYADDNYLMGEGKTEMDALEQCKERTELSLDWFLKSGLCVNKKKTELCVFNRNDCRLSEVTIGGEEVKVLKEMRILGLIFDSRLNWYKQTTTAIEKANKAKQGLKLIAKFFTTEEMIQLSTSLFYSRLYYGAKVWLSSALAAPLKKKLWQASSKMLRIVQKDWRGLYSYKTLHKISNRATPEMWANYSTACAMFDVVSTGIPEDIVVNMTENFLNSARNEGLLFTRSNKIKIGFNCLSNRLQKVSSVLKNDNWMRESKISFKLKCKRVFILDELQKM